MTKDKRPKRSITPRESMAFCNKLTTSSPTTSEQLKPFVHLSSIELERPCCLHGNENVKPRGYVRLKSKLWFFINKNKQFAM